MRIAVLGTGYVGLVSAACFAQAGQHVTCIDIDEGKVVEVGPHAALLARGGLYAHLVARQLAAGAALTAS